VPPQSPYGPWPYPLLPLRLPSPDSLAAGHQEGFPSDRIASLGIRNREVKWAFFRIAKSEEAVLGALGAIPNLEWCFRYFHSHQNARRDQI
jgi:hypothetical protein